MTRRLLAPLAVVAALALSGCGVTLVSDGASSSSTSSSAPAPADPTTDVTSAAPDTSTSGASTSSTSSSDTSVPEPGSGSDDITYASWQARLATVQKEMPCDRGPVTLSEPGSVVRLVGSCGTVTLEGEAMSVIAGDVEQVVVGGSGVVLAATSIGSVTFESTAFASEIYWVDGQPDVTDQGAGNVARAIPEGS